jgi:telomere length regulation protein
MDRREVHQVLVDARQFSELSDSPADPGLTHTLILSLSLSSPSYLLNLSHRSQFLYALQAYLSHPDAKIRRLGMLVAELVSELTIEDGPETYDPVDEVEELKAGLGEEEPGKKRPVKAAKRLKFGKDMWDGSGEGREECRWLRGVLGVRDNTAELSEDPSAWLLGWTTNPVAADPLPKTASPIRTDTRPRTSRPKRSPKRKAKIVMLDDQLADPLSGYASPSSSRSPSPTPSYLEEVAADPTLALDSTQKKKVTRPVYIQQVVMLLKEREKPDELEMGLKWGEDLVRAKRLFGSELGGSVADVPDGSGQCGVSGYNGFGAERSLQPGQL